MDYLEALQWRYSVKKFSGEKIPEEELSKIIEAARLSASSMGLQPYKLIAVESREVKNKLSEAFYQQQQVETCSHILVFLSRKIITENYIDTYFNNIAETRGLLPLELKPFRNSVEGFTQYMSPEESEHWSEKQAYIALGNTILAAALEKIDTCPMEGFNRKMTEEILEIDSENYKVAVALAIGYRAGDDPFQHLKKVRKPLEKFIERI